MTLTLGWRALFQSMKKKRRKEKKAANLSNCISTHVGVKNTDDSGSREVGYVENDTHTPRKAQCWHNIYVLGFANYFLREQCYFITSHSLMVVLSMYVPVNTASHHHKEHMYARMHMHTHTHTHMHQYIYMPEACNYLSVWVTGGSVITAVGGY